MLSRRLERAPSVSVVVYLENANRLFSSRLTYPQAFPFRLSFFSVSVHFLPPFVGKSVLASVPLSPLSIRYTRKFMSASHPLPHSIFRFPFFIETDTFCFLYRHYGIASIGNNRDAKYISLSSFRHSSIQGVL